MDALEELKARALVDFNAAQYRGLAVEAVETACHTLIRIGFKPEVSSTEGKVSLLLDLFPGVSNDQVSPPVAEIKHEPEPVEKEEPAYKAGPFSMEEDAAVIEMAARGRSREEIAQALGRSVSAIHGKCGNFLKDRIEDRRKALNGVKEVSAPAPEPEPERVAVDDGLKRGPLSDDEKEAIIEMAARGRASDFIAENLKRVPNGVRASMMHLRAKIEARKAEIETAKIKAEGPAPTSKPVHDLHGADAVINHNLDVLGYERGWSANRDLALVMALARGEGISGGAEAAKTVTAEARKRWAEVNEKPRDLNHQTRLIRILKMRAGADLVQAAE